MIKKTTRPATPFQIRSLKGSDSTAVRNLFRKIFNEDMSAPFWQWKYDHDKGCGVVVYRGGELVAHYGGVGVDIRYMGQQGTAVQITDVMVDPAVRNAVRESSPFFLAGSTFLENFIGYENPYLLGYGFPSDRHMKLAEILRLYAPVGRMWEVAWKTGKTEKPALSVAETITAENFAKYESAIDNLWGRFRENFADKILRVKNASYFRKRYLGHPEKHYSVVLIKGLLSRRPLALLVLHHGRDRGNESSMLMDILARDLDLSPAIKLACSLAAQAGSLRLTTWCSEAFKDTFDVNNAKLSELQITTPANIWTQGPKPEDINNRWWLMPGDTDYL